MNVHNKYKINTIIVDPRELNSIIHELAHYIYEKKLSFTLDNIKYEYKNYKNTQAININITKHKYEEYSDNSEIFALWFEKHIIITNKLYSNNIK